MMADERDNVSETGFQKQSIIDVNNAIKSEKNFSCCSRKCNLRESSAKKMEWLSSLMDFK